MNFPDVQGWEGWGMRVEGERMKVFYPRACNYFYTVCVCKKLIFFSRRALHINWIDSFTPTSTAIRVFN